MDFEVTYKRGNCGFGGDWGKVTFLVVTQKNVLVLVVTQKSALVLVVTKKNALVLVVILLLVVTEISLRRKKAYVVVTNRTDLARQSYLVSPIAHKSTVLSAKGIK